MKIKEFLSSTWLTMLLIVSNVVLLIYIGKHKQLPASNLAYIKTIDSLERTILRNESIYKNAIGDPILIGVQWDSLISAYETETGLQRLRDSLEYSLSKKHSNK